MLSVLRLIGVGDSSKLRMVAHTFGRSFNHEVEAVEGALPRRKDAMTVCREVLRFSLVRSSTEVQSPFEPDPNRGVTCGRPSGRTVESQYTSAPANSSRACDHSVGVAFGLLKALSSVTGTGSAIPHSDRFRSCKHYSCWIDRRTQHRRPRSTDCRGRARSGNLVDRDRWPSSSEFGITAICVLYPGHQQTDRWRNSKSESSTGAISGTQCDTSFRTSKVYGPCTCSAVPSAALRVNASSPVDQT